MKTMHSKWADAAGQALNFDRINNPECDLRQLNGKWRLLYASEAAYRSSPFFWAFRQSTRGLTSPLPVPGAAGGALADAIFAITDGIPFYDVGNVVQT